MIKQFSLMGGLGNQLFQYARALSEEEDSYLVDLVPNNRRNSSNLPDLVDFKLADSVQLIEMPRSLLSSTKLLNYSIRLSAKTKSDMVPFFNVETLLQLHTLLLKGKNAKFAVANGIDDLCKKDKADCYIGYFQNYKLASWIRKIGLELHSPSAIEEEYSLKSKVDFPLIVHYRLTDYLSQDTFGTPNLEYYREAINFQLDSGRYRKIWVFSDDIQRAKEMFPSGYLSQTVFVNESNATSSEILQLMRLGFGYVIANSTFSWWAASLSRAANPIVVAPEPWFASLDSPGEILHPAWVKMKSRI